MEIALKTLIRACFASLVLIVASCSEAYDFQETAEFANSEWRIADTAIFHYTPAVASTPRNINIALEHETDYNFANLFLFTTIQFPSGKQITDTIQYILIDNNYNWVGNGSGSSKSAIFPFKQSVVFPEEGAYTFKGNGCHNLRFFL